MTGSYNGMPYIEGEPFNNSPEHTAEFIHFNQQAWEARAYEAPAKGHSIRQFAVNPLRSSPFSDSTPDYLAVITQGCEDDAAYLEARSKDSPDHPMLIWDKTPEDAEIAAQLQKWTYPIHLRLKQLLGPSLISLAQRTRQRIQEYPDDIREMAGMAGEQELPYAVATLPPDLFDHVRNVTPFLPQTDTEAIRLVK